MKMDFDLESYNYYLPKEFIAQYPLLERDGARLLVFDRENNKVEHRVFSEIDQYFSPGDCLVLNQTKVIPARLKGEKKSGGKVEVLLLKCLEDKTWETLVKPMRSFLGGEKIIFPQGLTAVPKGKQNGKVVLEFNFSPQPLLEEIGEMPLPPYIKRKMQDIRYLPPEASLAQMGGMLDRERYQTVYADEEGAIAAPTAGLHFTHQLLEKIKSKGVEVVFLTLHIGTATFQPVRSADIRQHRLEKEHFFLSNETAEKINLSKERRNKVIACGTSVTRVLESRVRQGKIEAGEGDTNFYIYPGYDFKIIDFLITNFHLPRSTNLILVSAFAGREKTLSLYQTAKEDGYRFYSYGDAMLIL